jgi:sulfate/thiosulfate transport system ATP-binding protein
MFSFIGESSALPLRVDEGRLWLDGRLLDLQPGNVPDGPATLFLRPRDVDLVDNVLGAFPGIVSFQRRQGGSRRLDLQVSGYGERVEIEVPANFIYGASEVAIRPRRFRVYPS